MSKSEGKRRYQLVEDGVEGAVFVPNVDADTLETKVKSGAWKARPDLDAEAEKDAKATRSARRASANERGAAEQARHPAADQ